MQFEVYKSFKSVKDYYGDIPELPEPIDSTVEIYHLSKEEAQSFLNIVDDLNSECGAVLDDGDVDYFSGEKLFALRTWLENAVRGENGAHLQKVLSILADYVRIATECKTGVVIEL